MAHITRWLRILRPHLLCIASLTVICAGLLNFAISAQAQTALPPDQENSVIIYGPHQFVREQGKPVAQTDEFKIPRGAFEPFLLHIADGDQDKKSQVTFTTIYFNDELLLDGPTNKWAEDPMVFEIIPTENNIISVESVGDGEVR